MSILQSILDNDLYKFTMQQAVFHQFPNVTVKYRFVCRTNNIDFTAAFPEIKENIMAMENLKLSDEEETYLKSIRYIKADYIDFLKLFRFNPKKQVNLILNKNGSIELAISGFWLNTILYEVPLLAIINECYFKNEINKQGLMVNNVIDDRENRLQAKIKILTEYNRQTAPNPLLVLIDFGTRRRFSNNWHDQLIGKLKQGLPDNLIGTSNVLYAMKHGTRPFGTMAHEWLMAGQAQEIRLVNSQKYMLEKWVIEYRGDLGIALTDTISMDAFLRDFDYYFIKLYDGCRHDSGDPYIWADKLLQHYAKFKVNPMTKTAVFSDNLNFEKAIDIHQKYASLININFGIGTYLTNDTIIPPISIVIKMTECNGQKVAKLSDEIGKNICDDEKYLNYLKYVFHYPV